MLMQSSFSSVACSQPRAAAQVPVCRARAPHRRTHAPQQQLEQQQHLAALAPIRSGSAVPVARRRPRVAAAAAGNSAEAGTAVQAGLRELNQEEFWAFLESHSDKLTICDFYTDWCGPCKMIYPELVKINEELKTRGGQVVKFNCNKDNKELGKQLGIKVAPTFHLYRGREKLGEMTGAKVDKLREMIEANL